MRQSLATRSALPGPASEATHPRDTARLNPPRSRRRRGRAAATCRLTLVLGLFSKGSWIESGTDQLSSAQPGGSARPRHDSATEDSTGAQPTDGLRRGSVQTDRPGRPEQRLDQQTPGQAVVCPDNPARPIDQVRPKVVFGEEDLA